MINRQCRLSDASEVAGIQRVDESPCHVRFTNLLADDLGDTRHYVALKQCFRRPEFDRGQSQIRFSKVEDQPCVAVRFFARFHPYGDRFGRCSHGVRHVQTRAGERRRRRPLVVQRYAQPWPGGGRKAQGEFTRSALAENRNAIGNRGEALTVP